MSNLIALPGLRSERHTPSYLACLGLLRLAPQWRLSFAPAVQAGPLVPHLQGPASLGEVVDTIAERWQHDADRDGLARLHYRDSDGYPQSSPLPPDTRPITPGEDGKTRPDTVRMQPDELAHYHQAAHAASDLDSTQWLRALAATSHTTTDPKYGTEATPTPLLFTAQRRNQTLRDDIRKLIQPDLDATARREQLARLLQHGPRLQSAGGGNLFWDITGNIAIADHPDDPGSEASVTKGNRADLTLMWLAVHALPLLPLVRQHGHARPRGFTAARHAHQQALTAPLWTIPLDSHAVYTLLSHPALTTRGGRIEADGATLRRLNLSTVLRIGIMRWHNGDRYELMLDHPHPLPPRAVR